ncbi:phage tail tip lysozyme [Lactiplantibacillus plantarum]|uniref:phage tail tip lysozyme n=1 Tax=Lactiplantibacillus plantarum TaxID=1590 RepID=UPI001BAB12B2|nr:phage tail tip lysozyme [Lactiplantibacillus plantarum]MBS0936346.1 CHAP domain-containing protein [Lactiplantibacillus plantarum]MBS0943775.1 CHAP domain-containing protein [Lactiplantibacillus plantarum]
MIQKKIKGIALLATTVTMLSVMPISGQANFEGSKSSCYTSENSNDKDSDGTSGTGNAVAGEWTNKSTTAYKNAKAIFDHMTKKVGMSGAGASGPVAIAFRESGFDPKAQNVGGGVAGFFQWSGFSNNVNGNRIVSGGFIKAGNVSDLTVDNELKLASYELDHAYKKAKTTVGNAKDPKQAALDWSLYYEGVSLSDSQTKPDEIVANAKVAYELFGGSKIPASSALSSAADTNATDSESTGDKKSSPCDNATGDDTSVKGDIVRTAKNLIGYFTYGQVHGVSNIGSVDSPKKDGVTDCSGFVWLVLKQAGYKVPDNMAWYTKTMEDDAKGKHQYLKEISADDAKPGDVIIVNTGSGSGNEGHTAILTEVNKGGAKLIGNKTKIIQEGGSGGDGGVNEGTIDNSFGFFEGKSPSIMFAAPIKK